MKLKKEIVLHVVAFVAMVLLGLFIGWMIKNHPGPCENPGVCREIDWQFVPFFPM